MKEEISHDLIERYLNGTLSDAEKQAVEDRLIVDKAFCAEMDLQKSVQQHLGNPDEVRLRHALDNMWKEIADSKPSVKQKPAQPFTVRSASDPFANQMYFAEADFKVLEAVKTVAAGRGVSNAQVALAWMLHKPGVSAPIIGASKLTQLDEAIAACELKLSSEEIAALEAPYAPHAVLGH